MNIATAALEHLWLVLLAVGLAAAFGLPGAIWAARHPGPGTYLLRAADLVQTIPSLALFGLLLPIIGIGPRMAVIALFAYALLPILRNTVAGLQGVPEAVKESAVAMGLTPRQVLREVELPLAAPAIVAGLRIATVTTIGTDHRRSRGRRWPGHFPLPGTRHARTQLTPCQYPIRQDGHERGRDGPGKE